MARGRFHVGGGIWYSAEETGGCVEGKMLDSEVSLGRVGNWGGGQDDVGRTGAMGSNPQRESRV